MQYLLVTITAILCCDVISCFSLYFQCKSINFTIMFVLCTLPLPSCWTSVTFTGETCLMTSDDIVLSRYLGDVRLLTTACCIKEMESLGPAVYGALMITKSFPVYKCGHKTPLSASQCLASLVSQGESHLMVATQDASLR